MSDDMVVRLYRQGLNLRQIAELFGVHINVIVQALKRNKIPRRKTGYQSADSRRAAKIRVAMARTVGHPSRHEQALRADRGPDGQR